jgi:subtilisin family serine protease
LAWLLAAGVAQAQIALPATPQLPIVVPQAVPGALDVVDPLLERGVRSLSTLRERQVRQLLRRHRDALDVDPDGAPVVRAQVVAIDPAPGLLPGLHAAGFRVQAASTLEALQLRVVLLQGPDGLSARQALALARQLDPAGSYDYNHLYLRSGAATPWPILQQAAAMAATPAQRALRVGLVDGAPDPNHPALAATRIHGWGCGGNLIPDAHGTAVASLLAGRAVSHAASGATLYAADVYCGAPTGGAAAEVVRALSWLAGERVAVVNLSLVGPPNRLLERAVARMAAQGHLVIAAVGNDGPAAAPLYPAAYPGVVGVAAVNAREQVLPESGRGLHVDFAAPGADIVAAAPGGHWHKVRGTSYAAPLVARLAAEVMDTPGEGRAEATLLQLERQAKPARGPREAYGRGVLGSGLGITKPPPQS